MSHFSNFYKNKPLSLIYHGELSTYTKFNDIPLQTYKNT